MARRKNRKPPTPVQRRVMIAIGALLVFLACFVVLFETIINEDGHPITVAVVSLMLFLVFILPIIMMLRQARHASRQA